jgi:hypothetical protein
MTPDIPPRTECDSDDELAFELTVAIAEAVADAKGVSPFALNDTLYDSVDPDALADLVRSFRTTDPAEGAVSFRLADCTVDVHATGVVFAQPDTAARPVSRSFDTDTPVAAGDDRLGNGGSVWDDV